MKAAILETADKVPARDCLFVTETGIEVESRFGEYIQKFGPKANKKRIAPILLSRSELEEQKHGTDPYHHHNPKHAGQVYRPFALFFRRRDADAKEEAKPAQELN